MKFGPGGWGQEVPSTKLPPPHDRGSETSFKAGRDAQGPQGSLMAL